MKLCVAIALLVGLAQAQRAPPRKAYDTSHLDDLDRDELRRILDQIENSAYSKSTSAPRKPASSYVPSTPRPSSDIDDILSENKAKRKSTAAPLEELLRRLRSNTPYGSAASPLNYPAGGYNAPVGPRRTSPPYRTSYDTPLFIPEAPPSYPSGPVPPGPPRDSSGRIRVPQYRSTRLVAPTRDASYNPIMYGRHIPKPGTKIVSYYPFPSERPSIKPSAPLAPSLAASKSVRASPSSSYTPSGSYGGYAPAGTTTRKPQKGLLRRLFG